MNKQEIFELCQKIAKKTLNLFIATTIKNIAI